MVYLQKLIRLGYLTSLKLIPASSVAIKYLKAKFLIG